MPAIAKNIRKTGKYAIGGVLAAIAWPTTIPATGARSATYTGTAPAVSGIALTALIDDGGAPVLMEPEDGKAFYTDNVAIGNNTNLKPTFGGQFAALSDDLNVIAKAMDLTRHTYLVKTFMGKYKLLGRENGLKSEKNDSGAQAGNDGFAGFDFVVSGAELDRAPDVPESVWNSLLALCTNANATV